MERRAPDLSEAPVAMADELRQDVERALVRKAKRPLRVEGRVGLKAAVLLAVIGDERRSHELFVFSRAGAGTDALDRCIDYLDGIIDELVRDEDERFLPLDWEGRPFAGGVVFVRGEVRDYVAEVQAAELLGETAPPRGLG